MRPMCRRFRCSEAHSFRRDRCRKPQPVPATCRPPRVLDAAAERSAAKSASDVPKAIQAPRSPGFYVTSCRRIKDLLRSEPTSAFRGASERENVKGRGVKARPCGLTLSQRHCRNRGTETAPLAKRSFPPSRVPSAFRNCEKMLKVREGAFSLEIDRSAYSRS
jgi:hypothetical protein